MTDLPLWPPRIDLCPACGEKHTYVCGRTLITRDPKQKEEACPDGHFVCRDCVDIFGDFMKAAYDAKAVRQEWDDA